MKVAAWLAALTIALLNILSVLHGHSHCHECEHHEQEGRCLLIRALVQPVAEVADPVVIVRWTLAHWLAPTPPATPANGTRILAASRGPPVPVITA